MKVLNRGFDIFFCERRSNFFIEEGQISCGIVIISTIGGNKKHVLTTRGKTTTNFLDNPSAAKSMVGQREASLIGWGNRFGRRFVSWIGVKFCWRRPSCCEDVTDTSSSPFLSIVSQFCNDFRSHLILLVVPLFLRQLWVLPQEIHGLLLARQIEMARIISNGWEDFRSRWKMSMGWVIAILMICKLYLHHWRLMVLPKY